MSQPRIGVDCRQTRYIVSPVVIGALIFAAYYLRQRHGAHDDDPG
jgi:hypothetical protein